MHNLYTITFSPTGTSQLAADRIAEAFETKPVSVDLCQEVSGEIQIEPDSVCILSAPCYGGRIPETAVERFSHIRGNGAAAIVCVTYGNRAYEDALLELADCAKTAGCRVIAGCAAVGEHNIMHIYGTGRPDASDLDELHQFAVQAARKIEAGLTEEPVLPGNRPYKERHVSTMKILTDENTCKSCGLCAAKCPVRAISDDGRHVDETLCINCMRCIKICPEKCRKIPEELVSGLIQRVGKACEGRKANEFYL